MWLTKENLIYIYILSFFLPKYNVIDLSLFLQIALFLFIGLKYRIKVQLNILLLALILFYLLLNISILAFTQTQIFAIAQVLKDLKLILALCVSAVLIPTLSEGTNLIAHLQKSIVFLFTINNSLMALQMFNENIRDFSLQLFNFGNVGFTEFEDLAVHSYGLRVNGIFQSFDLASIWMSFFLMLIYSKLIKSNIILTLSTFILLFFVSRTGVLLFFLFLFLDIIFNPNIKKIAFLFVFNLILAYVVSVFWEYFFASSFAWLIDDIIHEFSSLKLTLSQANVFGNYLPFYSNGSTSDVGYVHIILTYGLLFFIALMVFYFEIIFYKIKNRHIRLILFVIYIIGSFKTALVIGRGFWELFIFFAYVSTIEPVSKDENKKIMIS